MLRSFLRVAFAAVVAFACLIAALLVAARDETLPYRGADTVVHLDASRSGHSKISLLAELAAECDQHHLELYRVAADPHNFYGGRILYRISAGATPDTAWPAFAPGRETKLRPLAHMEDTPLSGPYVMVSTPDGPQTLKDWGRSADVDVDVEVVPAWSVAKQALLSLGGWLPSLAALSLMWAVLLAWYVLRARSRSLKVLQGTATWRIVAEDSSQAWIVGWPALPVASLPLVVLLVTGRAGYAPQYLIVLASVLAAIAAAALLWMGMVAVMTWPSVASIANREPPERPFRWVGEMVKVTALGLVLIILPGLGLEVAKGVERASSGAQWAALNGHVTVRTHFTVQETDQVEPRIKRLADIAQSQNRLALSFTMEPGGNDWGSFDRFVLVDSTYLALMSATQGWSSTATEPLGPSARRVAAQDMTAGLKNFLRAQLDLLAAEPGLLADGREATYWTVPPEVDIPFLGKNPTVFDRPAHPLVVVVTRPASVLRASTVTSLLSSGNMIFAQGEWLSDAIAAEGLSPYVLSLDRVSDSGLAASQAERTRALLRLAAAGLAALAAVIGQAVSATAWALGRRRALVVQWTLGASWWQMLGRRALWELATVLLLGGAACLLAGQLGRGIWLWPGVGAAAAVVLAWWMHRVIIRTVIGSALMRRG